MRVLVAVVAVCTARGEWKPSAVAELPMAVDCGPLGLPPTHHDNYNFHQKIPHLKYQK